MVYINVDIFIEAVSKPWIRFEGEAQIDEKRSIHGRL